MILNKIITNKNLAWDKKIEKSKHEYLVTLSSDSLRELAVKKDKFNKLKVTDLKILQNEICTLKQKMLVDGFGFFIIDGTCLNQFSKAEQKSVYILICKIIGDLLVQNIEGKKLVEIKNQGKSLKNAGRYHQTNQGGSYHSDSPQWEKVPDYVGTFCVNPAKKGGTNKLLSAYTIHNKLLYKNEGLLKILYNNFHFDKRGEFKKNESATVFEPIFEYKDGKLSFRYLRDYIDGGHKLQNKPLSERQMMVLNIIDESLGDEDLALSYDIKSGDMLFFNNHRVIHGRTSFEDYEEERLKRLLIRVWIKEVS